MFTLQKTLAGHCELGGEAPKGRVLAVVFQDWTLTTGEKIKNTARHFWSDFNLDNRTLVRRVAFFDLRNIKL